MRSGHQLALPLINPREPHDETRTDPHGFADTVTIATCQCGATFEGRDGVEALTLWAEHVDEHEQ